MLLCSFGFAQALTLRLAARCMGSGNWIGLLPGKGLPLSMSSRSAEAALLRFGRPAEGAQVVVVDVSRREV